MEKHIINPWQWQNSRSYVQAVDVKHAHSTLYVSGQAAVHPDGRSSAADMKTQLHLSIKNLEQVFQEAGYEPKDMVRLTVYTTSSAELGACFSILQDWLARHKTQQTTTLLEVKSLFETLTVELEATLVK